MLRISELRNKDVIDIRDGRRIGFIEDIDLDMEHGRIESIIIPGGTGRMFSLFSKGEESVISWRQIKKIGVDVILIDPDARIEPMQMNPVLAEAETVAEEPRPAVFAPPVNPFQKDPFADQDELFDL